MHSIEFNAKAVHVFKLDKNYRVYLDEKKIYFIQVGKQQLFLDAVFEILNQILSGLGDSAKELLLNKFKSKKRELDNKADSKFKTKKIECNNGDFIISEDEISEVLLKASRSDVHGKCFGIWKIKLENSKKFQFQFETTSDFDIALEILPKFIGNKLVLKNQEIDSD